MQKRFVSLFVVLSIFIFGCAPKEQVSRLIPLEDFFKNPESTGYDLSPDGTHLAFLKPWENRLNVHVQKIGEEGVTRITSATERDIAGYIWANNERIAYVQDTAGDENFRVYAVNIDGSGFKELTPFEKVRVGITDELENDPDHMLIEMNKRDARVFDVYRININTGQMEMIAQNPGNITGWITDHDGKLRLAQTTDGVNTSVLYRDTEKDDFQNLITTSFKNTFLPIFFTFDNKNLYVVSNIGRDKEAIYEYDIQNKKNIRLIYEHPEVDVNNLMKSDKRKKITGTYYYTEKLHYHFFDEDREQLKMVQEELFLYLGDPFFVPTGEVTKTPEGEARVSVWWQTAEPVEEREIWDEAGSKIPFAYRIRGDRFVLTPKHKIHEYDNQKYQHFRFNA